MCLFFVLSAMFHVLGATCKVLCAFFVVCRVRYVLISFLSEHILLCVVMFILSGNARNVFFNWLLKNFAMCPVLRVRYYVLVMLCAR